jgi:type IV secretion system protein VirB8
MRVEDRFVNPLGFEVLRYRRDAEALPSEPDTPPPPAAIKVPVATIPVQGAPTQAAPARPAAPEPEL